MSPQVGWILKDEVVPRLRASIPRNVSQIGSEDAEELIQDATCMAARLLHNAERQNKQVTPGNVAYFTLLHMKSGRRSTGNSNADVLGSATQLNQRSQVYSFDEPVQIDELGEEFTVNDVLSLDDEDPAQKAGRKMDWEFFLAGLTEREKAVVEYLLAGRNMSELARNLKIDRSTVQNFKNRLADKILDYMGPNILVEIRRTPGWKNNLNTTRERLASMNGGRSTISPEALTDTVVRRVSWLRPLKCCRVGRNNTRRKSTEHERTDFASMHRYEFHLRITADQYLDYYRGTARHVVARCTTGQNVQFTDPAKIEQADVMSPLPNK